MMLIEEIKNIKSAQKDLRNFGLTVGIALVVFGGVFWYFGKTFYPYLIALGAALILSGLLFPVVLRPLQKVWMTFAVVMGWVMTRVILSLLFFVVFTAVGLAARLWGKKFLSLKWKQGNKSYWHLREPGKYDRRRSEMQF